MVDQPAGGVGVGPAEFTLAISRSPETTPVGFVIVSDVEPDTFCAVLLLR